MGLWKVSETKAGKSHQIQGHPGQTMPQGEGGKEGMSISGDIILEGR